MQYGGGPMSADNRALLAAVFDGLAQGDGRAFNAALADEAVWNVIGSNVWSGAYRGKAEIRERLLKPLVARVGVVRSIADRIIVDGDWAAVQFHGDNQTLDGERYDNRYVFILRLEEGRIVEITEYMDTELVSRVLGPRAEAASS